ncbi:MAG: hypothetical protein HC852_20470 [Acaryochloridaceae cyanobacterium RU_4_10]|nr:hypothetical protein [Acaryochloridaceae cyanobacterium RU_4_10]
MNWIEAYLNDALVPPEHRVQPEPKAEPQQQTKAQQRGTANRNGTGASTEADPALKHPILTKTLKDGQPFVSYLLKVSQGLRLPNPDFEFQ